jgi:hypothetical protein
MKKNEVFMRKLRPAVFSLALAVLTSLTIEHLSIAAQNPPTDNDFTVTIPAGGACAFGVEISVTGKMKTIMLPGGRSIITSPGLHATLTNLDDPTKTVTLNITGASHVTEEQDGSMVIVFTGRNLNLDPQAGFVLAIGNFSIVFDAAGNLIQPLEGKGRLLDVCAMID